MAGDWIKWCKGLASKREVIVLASKLSRDRHEIAARLMLLWEWCDDNLDVSAFDEQGHASLSLGDEAFPFVDSLLGIAGFCDALASPEVRWISARSGGRIVFPNFGRHNGTTAKARAYDARKKQAHRARASPDRPDEKGTPLIFSDSLPEILDFQDFRISFGEWLRYKAERRETYKEQGLASMISRAARLATKHGLPAVIDAMERAIANHWAGWDQPSVFAQGRSSNGKPATTNRVGPGQRYREPSS